MRLLACPFLVAFSMQVPTSTQGRIVENPCQNVHTIPLRSFSWVVCSSQQGSWIYIYIHTHVMCIYIYRYRCVYVCIMHVCMYACMYVGMCVCMYIGTYVRRYVCMYVCMYTVEISPARHPPYLTLCSINLVSDSHAPNTHTLPCSMFQTVNCGS